MLLVQRKIYLDADGVLVNFDKGYEDATGIKPTKGNVDWNLVGNRRDFYLNLEPMPDMQELLDFCAPFRPTILTGIPPVEKVPEAAQNKRDWFKKHVGDDLEVICTRSKLKSEYCTRGDVLIDDWTKYRHLWEQKGGIWITHLTAAQSIDLLGKVIFG